MRVLLTNEYGDKDVMEAIDVNFDEENNQLNIFCIDEITSYIIKADEDNEAVLRDSINTLLIKGYVDLSAYKAQDYNDDDEDEIDSKDCEENTAIDIDDEEDEIDSKDCEENTAIDIDKEKNKTTGIENITPTKKGSFFSKFR